MDLGRVDLNLLVVLDALLRERNVTRAGQRLRLSQPATSTALGRLRRMFNDPLLVRQGRQLRLTPRAEALIEPVAEALAIIDHAISDNPDFDPATDERTFTVMGSDYVSITLVRPLLVRLAGPAPGVRVNVRPIDCDAVRMVRRGEIDLAVLPEQAAGQLADCSREPVCQDRFVGVVWDQHPDPAVGPGARLTVELLGRLPYLRYGSGTHDDGVVEQALTQAGIARKVDAGVTGFAAMPMMLRGTRLVALLPERLAGQAAHIRILEPDFPLPPLRETAFWNPLGDRDPAHRWLRAQLRAVAAAEFADTPEFAGTPEFADTRRFEVV
jgi:DNA-binding transcriptional LysR family regulator